MRIFITGATGYLGSAITRELSRTHDVTALVRSAEKRVLVVEMGATPLEGDLRRPEAWIHNVGSHHAVVHLAMESSSDRGALDERLTRSMIAALRESSEGRLFVYTSVLFVLGDVSNGANETTLPNAPSHLQWRADLEREVLESAGATLRCAVIRPGMVYGGGNGGAVSELFRGAAEEGVSTYVGSGDNRWPLVHRQDVAALYRLIIEKRASGIYHAVDEQPLPVREVAELASQAAGKSEVASIPVEEARAFLGPFADALTLDQPVAASHSREIGWQPSRRDFFSAAEAAWREWLEAERQSG